MNNEELRDELLAISNSQSRIYVYFKKLGELVGVPVRPGVRRLFARLGNKYASRFADCYSSYMLDMDKNGRLYIVKHRSFLSVDESALTFKRKDEKYENVRQSNLVYYNLLTEEEVDSFLPHRKFPLVEISIFDEKLKPIKGLENLYCEHAGLVDFLTFDHDKSDIIRNSDNYLDLIKSPGDANAYLALLQTSRHMYGNGVATRGIETTKKIILDGTGKSSAIIAGQMIPIDNALRYKFADGELDEGVVLNNEKLYSDTRFRQHYYALMKIYKKLGFDVKTSKFLGCVADEGEINIVDGLHPLVVAKFKKDYIGSLPKEFLKPDENEPIEF